MPPAVLPVLASQEQTLSRKSSPWMKPGFFSLFPGGLLPSLFTFSKCSFSGLIFSSFRLLLVVAAVICCVCTSKSSATSIEIQVHELLRETPHHSSPFPGFFFCTKNTLSVSLRGQRSLFCFSSLSFAEKRAEWRRSLPIHLRLGGNNDDSRPFSLSRRKETSAVLVGTGWRNEPEQASHFLRLFPHGFRKRSFAYLTSRIYPSIQSPELYPLGPYDCRDYINSMTRMPGWATQRYVHSSSYLPLQTSSAGFVSSPQERKTKSSAIYSLFRPVTPSRRRVASCITGRTPTDSFVKTGEATSAAAGRNGLGNVLFQRGQEGLRTGVNLARWVESSFSTALWGAGKGRAQQKKGPTRAGASRPKGTDKKSATLKKGSKAEDKKKKKGEEKLQIPLKRTSSKGGRQRQEDLFSELTKDNLDGRDLPHGLIPPLQWELYKTFGRLGNPNWPYTAEPATCKIFIERLFKGFGRRLSITENEFKKRIERDWNFLAPVNSSEFEHFDGLCWKCWTVVRDLKIIEEEEFRRLRTEQRREAKKKDGEALLPARARKWSLPPPEDIPRLTMQRRVNKEINQQGVHPAVLHVLWRFFSDGNDELTREQASARFESLVISQNVAPPQEDQEGDDTSHSSPSEDPDEHETQASQQSEENRDELDAYLEELIKRRKEKEAKRLLRPLTADRFVEIFQDEVEAAMESFDEDAYWAYHRGVMAERTELKEALARNAAFRQQRRRFARASDMLFKDIWRSVLRARNKDTLKEISRPTDVSSVWKVVPAPCSHKLKTSVSSAAEELLAKVAEKTGVH
ncbi:transmembrane protein [Cystoisospora suis]|uniref:Transmembrane protein n=1 Tax=Cystoisospora suis TaxID=483139 RepID=A0A2C6LEA6_9APIC|nr:transmembrane protein [Cystoisospora suis]